MVDDLGSMDTISLSEVDIPFDVELEHDNDSLESTMARVDFESGIPAEAEEKSSNADTFANQPFVNIRAHVERVPLCFATGVFNFSSRTADLGFKFASETAGRSSGSQGTTNPVNDDNCPGPSRTASTNGPTAYTNRRGERRSAEGWRKRKQRFQEYLNRMKRQGKQFSNLRGKPYEDFGDRRCNGRGAHRY